MKLTTKQKRKVNVNLTSLIDVLFLLIIFFTVSSTFVEQPGIELDLPEAESSEGHTTQKIIIYVDTDENIFLNKEMTSLNNLANQVKKLSEQKQKSKGIVLKADAGVRHGLIIRIMDLLRQKGIYKIIVSTEKFE
ncbi:MAG: hypothetical protein GF313_02905 [Caldithrix sp.]|nr:hypothetical protein [Caldithrix sp.]